MQRSCPEHRLENTGLAQRQILYLQKVIYNIVWL